ncbi:MAG: PIG-L deacetylase family protein [Promethearchaeia archaeon]
MNVLVIVAHPDDEILGVGGTLIKHIAAGDDVYICIITKAYIPYWSEEYQEIKKKEQNKVDEFLGIKKRYNLNYPTTKLNTIPHGEFNRKLEEIIQKTNPKIIYTHYKHDLNLDHRIIFDSVMVCARPFKKIEIIVFETLSETEWINEAFVPNYYIDISEEINKKIEAFKIYKSEVKEYPHPRSPEGIKILAQKRGTEICVPFAEAFQIIRKFWI